jgi:hypothetical protein
MVHWWVLVQCGPEDKTWKRSPNPPHKVCDIAKVKTQKVRGRNPCPYLFVEVLMLGTTYLLSYEWVLGLSVKSCD